MEDSRGGMYRLYDGLSSSHSTAKLRPPSADTLDRATRTHGGPLEADMPMPRMGPVDLPLEERRLKMRHVPRTAP